VIIPCFALERLQDLLCDLTLLDHLDPDLLSGIPVVLDSPLGSRANAVIAKAFERTDVLKDGERVRETWLGRGLFRALGLDFRDAGDAIALRDAVQEMLVATAGPTVARLAKLPGWRRIWTPATREGDERSRLEGPAVVLTGSGMCDGGPVQDYLRRLLPDASTKVLLTGFCGVQTVGGALQKIASVPLDTRIRLGGDLKLGGQTLPMREIRATIAKLEGYSAHADQDGLVDWLWNAKPGEEVRPIARKLFISHGTRQAREGLKAAIMMRSEATRQPIEIELPDSERWFDLDSDTWLEEGRTHGPSVEEIQPRIEQL
jgi:Cft2 family RNA processing exonuclease